MNPPSLLQKTISFIREEGRALPAWWYSLSTLRKLGPTLSIFIYWGLLASLHGLHADHFVIGLVIIALSSLGTAAGKLLRFLFPVFLTGILYDSMRYYSSYIRADIHVAFPYEFDKKFFGIATSNGVLTPNEFWQLHTSAILDFITGFFYLSFIAFYVFMSGYHALFLPARAKDPVQRRAAERIGPYVTWGFFWLNMLGYSTYYWFPAAPPWYVADHGLGPALMDTMASPAGAARFDHLLGTHFFTGMYGRSADVFGAIPSLHVAYPLLATLFAFQVKSLRTFGVIFYVIMCFSAVYLNHHYVIDILWGSAYAVLIFTIMNARSNWRARTENRSAPRASGAFGNRFSS
ncbi:MAG: phosphatase PAP2 family protein [Cryobacterium sp.]|nr:phosphatase PAP2 family protein [Oligoflexia bacterium]